MQIISNLNLFSFISKSVILELLGATLPLILALFLASVIGFVDMELAGHIGETAQAAIGISEQIIFLLVVLGSAISVGANAKVSRALGSGKPILALLYCRESLIFTVLVGLLASLAGYFFADNLMGGFAGDIVVAKTGANYLRTCSLGNFAFLLIGTFSAIFRAGLKTKYCLYMWAITSGSSCLLAVYFFYFGFVGLSRHSLEALSWSWNISGLLGVAYGISVFVVLLRSWFVSGTSNNKEGCFFTLRHGVKKRLKLLIQIGIPSSIAELAWIISNFMMYAIAMKLADSVVAQAAYSVALKVEEFCLFMPVLALSQAVSALSGHKLGSKEERQIPHLAINAIFLALVYVVLMGTLTYINMPILVKQLSSSEAVVCLVKAYLPIILVSLPTLVVGQVIFGVMEGCGRTTYPMVANSFVYMVLRSALTCLLLPLASIGSLSLPISIAITRMVIAVISIIGMKVFVNSLGAKYSVSGIA